MMCYAAVYILEACILWQYCSNLFSSKSPRQGEAVFLFTGYSILFFGSFFGGIISLCERYMNISCHIVHLILPWLPSIGYPYQGQGSPQSGAVLPCG